MIQTNNRDFFEKIGEISVKFSNIDFCICNLIYRLIISKKDIEEIKKYLKKFHKEMPTKGKINLCKELFSFKKLNSEFSGLISEIDNIRETRNKFIHGLIEFKEENIQKGFITIKYEEKIEGEYKEKLERYTIEELEKITEKLGSLVMELLFFTNKLFPNK